MDKYALYDALGDVSDAFLLDAEQIIQDGGARRKANRRRKSTVLAIAAAIAILGSTAAIATRMNWDAVSWVRSGFEEGGPETYVPSDAVLEEELRQGQWVTLEGSKIAVIVPESPVKIMLSDDGGETWRESVVTDSDGWEFLGEWEPDAQYYGGYIGFNGPQDGYLVLTSGVAMNHQDLRIYLTGDGGDTWSEIGNPYDVHISVLTGAGFASDQVGFISYRYYEDAGPDIWWTKDGGDTWNKLDVAIPEAYQGEQYRFTPQSPTFDGLEGTYPIVVSVSGTDEQTTIYMVTHDGGLTWNFES